MNKVVCFVTLLCFVGIMPLSVLCLLSLSLQPLSGPVGRRAVFSLVPMAAVTVFPGDAAHASYAMTQAAQQQHSWQETGREKELEAYRSIEASLDEKRRFRDGVGEVCHP